jgi:hypothetical protein
MIRPGQVLRFFACVDLTLIAVFFLAATIAGASNDRLVNLLDPNGEANLDSWYASSKLLLGAVAMLVISRAAPAAKTPVLLAILLCAMSLDEGAMIHERMGYELSVVRRGIETATAGDWPLLVGLPGLAVLILVAWIVFREAFFSRVTMLRFFVGISVLVAGALGIEVLGYVLTWAPAHHMIGPTPAVTVIEEGIENLGATLIIWATAHAAYDNRAVISALVVEYRRN